MNNSIMEIAWNRRWWLLLAGVLGAGLGLVAISLQGSSSATATTSVAVSDEAITEFGGEGYSVDELRQLVVAVADRQSTVDSAAAAAGVDAGVIQSVAVDSETRSPVITLRITTDDEASALAVADALVSLLAAERQSIYAETLGSALERRTQRLEELQDAEAAVSRSPGEGNANERQARLEAIDDATEELNDLEASVESAGQSVRQLAEPTLTTSTSSPIQGALLGMGGGLLGAFGLVVLLADRSSTRSRWNQTAGLWPQGWLLSAQDEPSSCLLARSDSATAPPETSELAAYRWVLARILRPAINVIGVAGTSNYDGSGATAIALAQAHASTGRNVALVSIDIPQAARSAEEQSRGLRSALTGELQLDSAVTPLKSVSGALFYLPPGQEGPRWEGSHEAIGEILRKLTASRIDLVILELPPLLNGDIEPPLIRFTDGVVISSLDRVTTSYDVNLSAEHLVRMGSSVLGEVRHTSSPPRPIFVVGETSAPEVAGADSKQGARTPQEGGPNAPLPNGVTELQRRPA